MPIETIQNGLVFHQKLGPASKFALNSRGEVDLFYAGPPDRF